LHTPIYNPRGGYVAFLGRISPEKQPDRAIRIARALGIRLKIAAKVDKGDEDYFREKIAPLLSDPEVEFLGEINERSKTEFLGEAQALLFPIDWPEPFGLDRRAVRRRFEQRFSSARIATDYVAVYRSLLKRPSISERETTVPMPRPVLEKRLNGQGLSGDRAHRAAETDALI
jgi:glycosyltransferase involved in cell wall biosynthesis